MSTPVSPAVEQFVLRHLRSLEHLEVLLFLQRHPTDWWNAESLAGTIGISAESAEQILEELCSANLLAVRVAAALSYQFNPGSPPLHEEVLDLVEALRTARPRIYALISSRSTRALREFADAFRWRRPPRG